MSSHPHRRRRRSRITAGGPDRNGAMPGVTTPFLARIASIQSRRFNFGARPGLLRLHGQFRFDANRAQDPPSACLVRCAVVAACLAAEAGPGPAWSSTVGCTWPSIVRGSVCPMPVAEPMTSRRRSRGSDTEERPSACRTWMSGQCCSPLKRGRPRRCCRDEAAALAGSLLSLELWAKGSHTIPSQTQLAIVALKGCPHAWRPRGFPGTVFGVSGYR